MSIPACTGQGVCIPACTVQGGVCPGGVYPSMHWGRPPPPLWTKWQTGVKTLSCCNYVADGVNLRMELIVWMVLTVHKFAGKSSYRKVCSLNGWSITNYRCSQSVSIYIKIVSHHYKCGLCVFNQWLTSLVRKGEFCGNSIECNVLVINPFN